MTYNPSKLTSGSIIHGAQLAMRKPNLFLMEIICGFVSCSAIETMLILCVCLSCWWEGGSDFMILFDALVNYFAVF